MTYVPVFTSIRTHTVTSEDPIHDTIHLNRMKQRSHLMILLCLFLIGLISLPMNQCPTEDSQWCYWNAQTQGNMVGNSFVATWEDGPIIPMFN